MKAYFLEELTRRFGTPRKLKNSQSLYEVGRDAVRLYFRYSKMHPRNRTFFGLRKVDLQELAGHRGIICFFWDGQREPLFVPFEEFEEVFAATTPARDGQIKAQVYDQLSGTELYLASAGKFNVESYLGWEFLEGQIEAAGSPVPELAHNQVQTLLGAIGAAKGFDVWIPPNDRSRLDWNLTPVFRAAKSLPPALASIKEIAEEVDVMWIKRGAGTLAALYEVEHSTPIYSGLLRFNDVRLVLPSLDVRFGIVSNDQRRSLFVRQIERPTFRASGLRELCTFFEYRNVFAWHQRIRRKDEEHHREAGPEDLLRQQTTTS